MQLLRAHSWRKSWAQIIPGNFSGGNFTDLLFYDRDAGQGEFYATDGNGGITLLEENLWRKTWYQIVPGYFYANNLTDLLFYDRIAGQGEFYIIANPLVPVLISTWTGTATLNINDERFPGPFVQNVTLQLMFSGDRSIVRIVDFPPIIIGPFATPIGNNTITITFNGGGTGGFDLATGNMQMPIVLHFDHSLPGIFVGDSNVFFDLTTGMASSPSGVFQVNGVPLNRGTGAITLVGASRFSGGFLDRRECSLVLAGNFAPVP